MNGTLTKDLLIEQIQDKSGLQVKECREILEIILESIKASLEKGEDVKISGFGKWTAKQKSARPGRNPHTGERIDIAARRVVTFHASDILRERIEQKAPHAIDSAS